MGNIVFDKLARPALLEKSPVLIFAADASAAFGIEGLGEELKPDRHFRTRPEFLNLLRHSAQDAYVDGILMTAADAETLAAEETIFNDSPVTPLIRFNAETHIWSPRHGKYAKQYSQPFQTIRLDDARLCQTAINTARLCHIPLGLYSITLNNDVEADTRTLNKFLDFAREIGDIQGLDYFLEVFLPNVRQPTMTDERAAEYVADSIVRILGFLLKKQKPLFIKTVYTTPALWRELCQFDPTIPIGAMGGSRKSTKQALQLAYDVTENGGKLILFGRNIYRDDKPRIIARALRNVLDRTMTVNEAYKFYKNTTV